VRLREQARSCSLIWIGSLLGVPYGVLGKRKFFALFYQNGAPDQTVLDIVIDERIEARSARPRRRAAAAGRRSGLRSLLPPVRALSAGSDRDRS
jgi:hypothetical protein